MVASFNLVLTMERGQKEALRAAFPEYASRVRLLSEMVGEIRDVMDPIGFPVQDFEDTAQEIEQILRRGYDVIRRLAEDKPNRSAS
jgi:protein-tyrosine phosphatase